MRRDPYELGALTLGLVVSACAATVGDGTDAEPADVAVSEQALLGDVAECSDMDQWPDRVGYWRSFDTDLDGDGSTHQINFPDEAWTDPYVAGCDAFTTDLILYPDAELDGCSSVYFNSLIPDLPQLITDELTCSLLQLERSAFAEPKNGGPTVQLIDDTARGDWNGSSCKAVSKFLWLPGSEAWRYSTPEQWLTSYDHFRVATQGWFFIWQTYDRSYLTFEEECTWLTSYSTHAWDYLPETHVLPEVEAL